MDQACQTLRANARLAIQLRPHGDGLRQPLLRAGGRRIVVFDPGGVTSQATGGRIQTGQKNDFVLLRGMLRSRSMCHRPVELIRRLHHVGGVRQKMACGVGIRGDCA